jgi:type II secretory pathway pseudopilin PulG
MEGRSVVEVHEQQLALRVRRGFTLMESLIASAILFAGVLAVISAIMAGQRKAFEAEQQVMATLAAEELMGHIATSDYDELSVLWSGLKPAGDFYAFVAIDPVDEDLSDLGVVVSGKTVNIGVFPSTTDTRVIVELHHFIPAPPP